MYEKDVFLHAAFIFDILLPRFGPQVGQPKIDPLSRLCDAFRGHFCDLKVAHSPPSQGVLLVNLTMTPLESDVRKLLEL